MNTTALRNALLTSAQLLLLGFAQASPAAESLKPVLGDLLQTSPRARAASDDMVGAEWKESETFRRLWTPNLDITIEGGRQRYDTESIHPPYRDADRSTVRLTQLLYDFGRSNRQVDEATAVKHQSKAVLLATRDGVLLDALMAHWSAVRARLVLGFARQSEASVLNLTQLENSMVELGKGYETNVLQAKVQLAGAEARRIRAEGALDIANARVAAVFGEHAVKVNFDAVVVPPQSRLPRTLDDAIEHALTHNNQLKVGVHRSQAISHRMEFTEAREFLPRLQLVAEQGRRYNWDSAIDNTQVRDNKILLQLTYNFNLGFAGRSAQEAVRKDFDASVSREREARDLVVEQVRIAWRNLLVARQNKETLANQVRIAGRFFKLATAERQLGRRSLLDILTAEVALINAMSDFVSTEVDAAIAALTLLQVTGELNLDALEVTPLEAAVSSASIR